MILYHGSDIEVRHPLVHVGRSELDFGPGFYLTAIKSQAERWAKRVCAIRATLTPVLSVYNLNERLLSLSVKWLKLEHYDQPWLDFITASRRGGAPWRNYDIIEGCVADDQVIDTIEDYFIGRLTVEQALGLLRFVKPTHQICINNQDIVDSCLRFDHVELLNPNNND